MEDTLVATDDALFSFVDAAVKGEARIVAARQELLHLMGSACVVDAAAVVAMFNGINKLADMTGAENQAPVNKSWFS